MGVIEELLKNKEDLLIKILQILEGKEATTKFNLSNITLDIGKSKLRLDGNLEITFVPFSKRKLR